MKTTRPVRDEAEAFLDGFIDIVAASVDELTLVSILEQSEALAESLDVEIDNALPSATPFETGRDMKT